MKRITIAVAYIDQVDEIKKQVDSIADPIIDKAVKDNKEA